jgi:polyketide biosynthesis 3-hydroxy-3-methylglutaryl-CoA synthase-like enzyme PksG
VTAVGIDALNVYCGVAQIRVSALFAGRGLDVARLDNLMMRARSVGLPGEDPVTNAVNAARPLLDGLTAAERDRIEVLVTATESGLDLSKSVASYVHEHLGLSRRCRLLEVKQACYAATGALQLAAGWVAAGFSPGALALVVATDVALVDARAGYAEPAMGNGAAALLVGADPRVLTLDPGASGTYSYETLDSARPTPTFDIADSDRSLFAYLDCLGHAFRGYADAVEGADFATTFDHLVMHTPFAGMVRAGHRTLMRDRSDPAAVAADFARRVAPGLEYPRQVGNLCSGSVYLALASMLEHTDPADLADGARVGLFSYGSGCSSEFFSGVVDDGSARAVTGQGIGAQITARAEVDFAEFVALTDAARDCLVPEPRRRVDPDLYAPVLERFGAERDLLVLTGTEDYHRRYDWVTAGR